MEGKTKGHNVVKITYDHYGEKIYDPKWCLVSESSGDACALCDGQFFGESTSSAKYKVKHVFKGGITCVKCLEIIKGIQAIRL